MKRPTEGKSQLPPAATTAKARGARQFVIRLLVSTMPVGVVAASSAVLAQSVWNGAGSAYGTAGNWSPNTVATGGGAGVFNGTGVAQPVVDLGAATFTPGTIAINGGTAYTIQNGTLTLGTSFTNNSTASQVVSAKLGGAGSVTQSGTGTLTLTGANTYQGGTVITSGVLSAQNVSALGSGAVSVASGGTLQLQGSETIGSLAGSGTVTLQGAAVTLTTGANNTSTSYSGTIGEAGGLGSLVKEGSGTLTLSGTNSYSGGTTVTVGTLSISADANLGSSANGTTLSGGTLQSTGTFTMGRTITVSGNSSIDVTGANVLTLSGMLDGNRTLTKSGTGSLIFGSTFNGAGYTGGLAITAGTLALSGTASIATSSGVTLSNSGIFDISATTAGASIKSLAGASTTSAVALGGQTVTLSNASGTFAGAIGGAGGGLTLTTGTEILSGANTYTGATAINSGTLALSGTGSIATSSGVTLSNSGIFDISATTAGASIKSLAGASTTSAVALGGQTLTLSNASGTFAGAIGGAGGKLSLNGGTETLSGDNTYTGDTLVDGGTLAFGANGQISGSRVQIDSGTLDVSGKTAGSSLSIVSLAGSGNVSLGNAGLTLGNADDTYGGVIAGAGTITVGSGREVFNGANTYTGLTAISSGATLVVGDSSHATAQVRGDVTVAGGTLGGFGTVLGDATVSSGGTLAAGDVGSVGTLTVNGNLTVGTGSKLVFDFGAPGPNFSTPGQSDHVVVNGNLSIGSSTLNVGNLGSMGPGLYNLFDWGGSLSITGGGFVPPAGMTLQVLSADRQINLIDMQGQTLNEWDADGRASASAMGGGSGTWSVVSNNWANTNGEFVGPMGPQPSFAIFGGTAGTVTIDNGNGAVSATGMQFTSGGYHLVGDTLDLIGQSGTAPVVRVSSSATATVDNVLTGTSGLNKTDGGTLVLNGNNLYQGTTTLSGGYLSVSSDANLGKNTNALDFEGGTLKITGTSFNQTSRNIVWGSAGGGFDIDDATNTFTVAQMLTGTGGLLKSGAGALLLNGQNTYSGGTIVSGGTFEVGDADHPSASVTGDVQVNATGTLRGHGTVAGSIVNGGTVSPGGSIGTLSVGGNYTQASNGVLAVEVSPTAASQLSVAGTATLNGVLAITYDPGTYTAKQYTLVAAGQGVNGQFSGVTKTVSSGADLSLLQQNVTYSANQVALNLADAPVGPANPTGPVVVAPTGISIYTALGSSISMGSQTANSALLARMNRVSTATADAPDSWIDATGAQTHVGGANGEPGYQANRYGFLAGLDSKVGDYTLGVATGYAHTDVDEQQTGDSATADTLRVALYGSRWFGPVGVSVTAGYALDFLSQKRPFGALGTAKGDHIGHEFTMAGQASMPLTFGSIVVTPSMGMRYAYFHANGFNESGAGGQDLDVGTDNVQSLQPYAQVTFDKAFGDALRPIDLQMRVGYAHEVFNANRAMSVTAQDGTVFSAPGTSLPRGYLTAGVSLRMEPTKAMLVSIAYDALVNTTHASAQAASLKLGYKF
jgi:fibronectin-binding autotransporter adhesin